MEPLYKEYSKPSIDSEGRITGLELLLTNDDEKHMTLKSFWNCENGGKNEL